MNKDFRIIFFTLFLLLTSSACTNQNSNFAPVEAGGGGTIPSVPAYVIVQQGETLGMLSRRYGVPQQEIIKANNLYNIDNLKVGQRLTLPVGDGRTYTAIEGDSVRSVAGMFRLPPEDLAKENDLDVRSYFRPGQVVLLPGAQELSVQEEEISSSKNDNSDDNKWINPTPVAVQTPNHLAADNKYKSIWLPAPTSNQAVLANNTKAQTTENAKPVGQRDGASLVNETSQINSTSETKPSKSSSGFSWPIRGKVVSGFGAKSAGQHNDGIDIAASSDTSVKAAKDGVVASINKGLKGGLGTIVLVQHKGGFITVYARLKDVTVKKGQSLKAGQSIASLEKENSKLHFQIRKNGQAVDPTKYLDKT